MQMLIKWLFRNYHKIGRFGVQGIGHAGNILRLIARYKGQVTRAGG